MKKLFIFDLDGTLAASKCALTPEMALLLKEALDHVSIAIISGGAYPQFEKQVLGQLSCSNEQLKKLFLFPTCGSIFYRFDKKWEKIYAEELTREQRIKILSAFGKMFEEVGFIPTNVQGGALEDRVTQITFSALGPIAPIDLKKVWDPDHSKRLAMIEVLKKYIPEFEIRTGGATSIDVTKKDIDKAYGIAQIEKHLGFSKEEMLFFGDALFDGGNDAPVKRTGVECISVASPEETMIFVQLQLGLKLTKFIGC